MLNTCKIVEDVKELYLPKNVSNWRVKHIQHFSSNLEKLCFLKNKTMNIVIIEPCHE